MKLEYNKAIDCSVKINDSFYRLQHSDNEEDDLFNDRQTAKCFERTTDFHTMAEAVRFIPLVGIRYNWQFDVKNRFNMLMVINLN